MIRRHFIKFFLMVVPMVACWFYTRKFWSSWFTTSYINPDYHSDHFDGKKFFNPLYPTPAKSFSEVLKWRMNAKTGGWPDKVPITPDNPPKIVKGSSVRVSFIGHASVLLQTQGVNILFDPVWDNRASPVSFLGPKRVAAPGIKLAHLPKLDFILISHNHYDHLSLPTLKKIHHQQREKFAHTPTIITPLGNGKIIKSLNISTFIKEGDWHDEFTLTKDLKLVIEPTQHWSLRGPLNHNRCLWSAFVLQSKHGNIYFAGDTGWGKGEHIKATAKYAPFRFAMIPIGAYEPRDFMKPQHINPSEAVKIAKILKTKLAMAMHLQTFKLTDEGYDDPVHDLNLAMKESKFSPKKFKVLKAGETLELT